MIADTSVPSSKITVLDRHFRFAFTQLMPLEAARFILGLPQMWMTSRPGAWR